MKYYPTNISLTLTVFFSVWAVVVANSDIIPGRRLLVDNSKLPLKPLLNHQDGIKGEERGGSILRGLLETRRLVCPSGFGLCPSTEICCQLDGLCCRSGQCCGPHQRCCTVGCCDLSDYCAVDPTSGRQGCCPLGEVCSGSSDTCEDAGFFPCPNEDICCPSGTTCVRESNGTPGCRTSGSNPPPTTRRTTTTSRATSTKTSFTTRVTSTRAATPTTFTTNTPSSDTFVFTTPTPSGISPTTYSVPSPSQGVQNIIVGPTDPRIIWVGSSWVLGTSSCNSTMQSKKTSEIGTFSIEADPGTTVYLALSAHNVEYEIKINDRSTTYSETTILDDCKLTWSSGILTTKTDIIITVLGPPLSSLFDKRQLSGSWSFEFHNFLMTMSDSTSINSTGLAPPGGPRSAAMSSQAHLIFYIGPIMAFVNFFLFF